MKKKILSIFLSMLMVFSTMFSVVTADAKETLTGTAWWTGSQAGGAYSLADNTTVKLNVDVVSTPDANGYAAFTVEVRDNGKGTSGEETHCITSSSDGNCYYFTDGGTTGDPVTGVAASFDSKVKAGEKYEISVTREGGTYTIAYYNVTTSTEVYRFVCANTNMTAASTVNFVAQVGTYDITVNGAKQTLTGTAWWTGSQVGGAYPLADNSTVRFNVDVVSTPDANGYAAFTVEVRDNGTGESGDEVHCITSSSDGNCYYFTDGGTAGDAVTGVPGTIESNVKAGEKYEVSVTREGGTYTIVYYNVTTSTEVFRFVCANTNMTAASTINFVSQVGTYDVEFVDVEEAVVQTIGAQTNDTDLGFVTTISKADFEAMDIKAMGVLVKNSANATEDEMTLANVGTKIKNIPTSYVTDINNLDNSMDDANTYAFRSIIKGVTNEEKEYTAVPYITYMDGEEEVTVYGAAITRSIAEINA